MEQARFKCWLHLIRTVKDDINVIFDEVKSLFDNCFDIACVKMICNPCRRKEGRGKIAPGLQGPRGLIMFTASKSGGPHKLNQQ